MDQLENKLNDFFTKTISYKLPEGARKGLVTAMPWLTLIGAILTTLGVLALLPALMLVSTVDVYGYAYVNTGFWPFIWLGVLVLFVEAVLLFVAFSPLKKHQKRGWNLVYWLSLVNIVYAIVNFLGYSYMNIGSLLVSLLGSAIGLYLLFQIRSAYMGTATQTPAQTPAAKK